MLRNFCLYVLGVAGLLSACSNDSSVPNKLPSPKDIREAPWYIQKKYSVEPFLMQSDYSKLYTALNLLAPGRKRHWYNEKTELTFHVQVEEWIYPTSDSLHAQPCRNYHITVTDGRGDHRYFKQACRLPNLTWEIQTD